MKKLLFYTGILLFGLSAPAFAKPDASHSIEQFKEILMSKIFVFESPLWKGAENKASATYLAKDGSDFQCFFGDYKNDPTLKHRTFKSTRKSGKWRLTKPFFSSGVLFTTNNNGTRSIPIYDEKTNVLERWYKTRRSNGWERLVVGHLQDTWPAWALEKCPDLKLPEGLNINYDQKTPDYKQNYEVHELTRTASKIVPVTENQARAYLFNNNGNILVDSDGQNYVMNGYHSEFWRIDDKLDITDIATFQAKDDHLLIQWGNRDEAQVYRFGDQVQLKPTGERHPAFAFSDWLQQQDIVEITLPETTGPLAVKFLNDTNFKAYHADGTQEAIGSWWFEGDHLTLSLTLSADAPGIRAMPWADAARQLGYPGNIVTK